jgi:hypothetical protein
MGHLIALLDVLIWPLTVVGLSLLFRAELRQLFDRLSKFKYKEFEATFDRELRQAELKAGQAALPAPQELTALPPAKPEAELFDTLQQLADVHPTLAIPEAWIQVEQGLLHSAQRHDLKVRVRATSLDAVRQLRDRGLIDQATYEIVNSLRHLRNQAVHAPDFSLSPDEARRYVQLASGVVAKLEQL